MSIPIDLRTVLLLADWTKSLARRVTHWYWVSLSTWSTAPKHTSRSRLGIQLSSRVYDNPHGVSMESIIWLDGVAHVVNRPVLISPANNDSVGRWNIHTVSGTEHSSTSIDLNFEKLGNQASLLNLVLVEAALQHMLGVYRGTVRVGNAIYPVEHAVGVLEDHYAKW
jgi:hypothetical protein